MCGIAGWFNLRVSYDRCPSILNAMCDSIAHRGPDDEGIYFDEHVGLGFKRLSIVDINGGHQPMHNDDHSIHIVFNGEIYNYVALRNELIKSGFHFKTTSDTEVILRLYERDGLKGFERMNGMFAVAIWDKRSGNFHLVRDRLGVKPLYYAVIGNALIFGSEIKAIIASGHARKILNERALWDYLTFRYIPAPETIWQGIYKLPPAHYLTFNANKANPTINRWWDIVMHAPEESRIISEYDGEFQDLFEDAVSLRMRADVPVGITLSGGLDSASVVAASSLTAGDLKTFSVSFENSPDTDELPYAREVAREFNTDHHEVIIGKKEFMDFLPDFVWHTDEPLADLASIPLHYVSKLARKNVKVVLSGEGADEIFGGYSFDNWMQQWDQVDNANANLPKWSYGLLGRLFKRFSPGFEKRVNLASGNYDQRDAIEPITMTNYLSSADKNRLFGSKRKWPDSMERVRSQLSDIGSQHPLNQVLHVYTQDWLVEDLLMKADKMSMANSLELRTPFLDYRLVEWAAKLPVKLKVGLLDSGKYHTKAILRRYAASRLPANIINRPKQGFPVPVYDWLSSDITGWVKDTLYAPHSNLKNILNNKELGKLVESGMGKNASMPQKHLLWNLLVMEVWMQKWL